MGDWVLVGLVKEGKEGMGEEDGVVMVGDGEAVRGATGETGVGGVAVKEEEGEAGWEGWGLGGLDLVGMGCKRPGSKV